ncbi:Actin-related protein 2/3 complex subunit 1 [Candida viswanathii]|jgi:actin related protein 2/3 complex subunit 1A/1B|uniref:Actin-related protein 2/3 complex subunit n=1 Tax=Candida viswanathii TaxID=5486 RepID=A0A367XZQ1_9ASCO|nr:Actin-related protein 2/3 complex subunit 1 [Candida viswanathii]
MSSKVPAIYQLGHLPIKDHVFSPDRSILAITKENEIEIYKVSTNNLAQKPKLVAVLKDHDKTVTSVDISPDGSKILTCSQDRNALVWEADASGEFKPTLVLLRINRSATVCRWAPDGRKFAVGSSDRIIAVCYYEEENDWWVSKHLKKPLKSTITTLDWHPNGVLLASGSTDGHVRVFSAYIKGIDSKPQPTVWGTKLPFQTLCGDFTNETTAWIHGVKFSPDGDSLAYVSHDSSLGFVYPQGEELPPRAIFNVKTNYLPFKSIVWLDDQLVCAGGFNCNLVVFKGNESGWKEAYQVEEQKDLTKEAPHSRVGDDDDDDQEISSHQALNMFKQMDLKGRVSKPTAGGKPAKALSTIHQNTINSIKNFAPGQVSTSGIDGKVVIFNV